MLLTTLFALLSPLVTAVLYFTLFPDISPLWMLPIAVGGFILFCVFHVLFLLVSAAFFSKEPPKRYSRFAHAVVTLTADWFLCLVRIRVRVKGKEKLPSEPFVLVSNHRAAMDALVALRAFPHRKLCFIAKSSILKWPIVGSYMLKSGCLFVERDMPLQSLRVINRAAKLIKTGMSFGIFPEGTRSKDGRVGEFKDGAFIAAKKAECPIVVVTMEGTEGSLHRFSSRVTVTVHTVIDKSTVREKTHTELSSLCRTLICEALKEEP